MIKKSKTYVEVGRPEIVNCIKILWMGLIYMTNPLVITVFIKSRKWTLRMLFHSFDMATRNS